MSDLRVMIVVFGWEVFFGPVDTISGLSYFIRDLWSSLFSSSVYIFFF